MNAPVLIMAIIVALLGIAWIIWRIRDNIRKRRG